ncbi:MAG: hypothetical protein E7627_02000 [Ruminococcaceae bacterium]|nr:hypothetical protein [Oscillospiraceae bacterium]
MTEKIKNIVLTCVMVVLLFGLTLFAWFKPTDDFSDSERRELAKFPAFNAETVFNKDSNKTFMKLFESYSLDQFPLRDKFRTLKSYVAFNVFGHMDNNNIYVEDGYAAQLEYPLNEESLDFATGKFGAIYDKFIKQHGANVYFSIVPDKGYFLAAENGYLALDYSEMFALMQEKMDFADYIDITGELELSDYYKTDTHWKQENLLDVAQKIGAEMGTPLSEKYTQTLLDNPFYGVYYGQSALPLPAEDMYYMTNAMLENCIVYDHQNMRQISIYDMERAFGKDPYEMYLGGNLSVVTIENPSASTDKELVVFRDSFGASLTPLLVEGYKKITVVDIRYVQSALLGSMRDNRTGAPLVDFRNADDVLFIYSTLILNNSNTLR